MPGRWKNRNKRREVAYRIKRKGLHAHGDYRSSTYTRQTNKPRCVTVTLASPQGSRYLPSSAQRQRGAELKDEISMISAKAV
ncbi:hypothetical protein PHYPO_G00038310 [Pangasianodon hypophthalmus]|uniref:Uncharacterized protein n=1 Tax=Pangasianodon hypophthalmus TaxID=310915 RepID=A0A5N5ML75_PANHP|nr:hypothetical protein PHYPO_G00038310 [Pangasianodon hypophthalmus]